MSILKSCQKHQANKSGERKRPAKRNILSLNNPRNQRNLRLNNIFFLHALQGLHGKNCLIKPSKKQACSQ